MSLPRFLEPLGPLGECREEASQPLAGLFVHEVARLRIELLAREERYLRFGHHVGWGMQEYLPRTICPRAVPLLLGSPRSRPACDGRAWGCARAQAPVQSGGQDARDSVVVLRCCYEYGVVGANLLPKLFDRFGVPLVLYLG